MSIKSEKFIDLLKQMFEIDKAELDFGIYRIINYKRNVINKFLNEDLQSSLETQIKKIDSNADGIEDSIYSHLTTFFGRYYDEGDFISQRRYKDGAYAIPYNGEEVKLYWANYDQYYIKSSENFKDYSFKAGDKKISFKLVEADTELNNNKSLEGNKYFVLDDSKEFISVNNNELIIKFQFKVLPKSNKQEKLNGEILESILDKLKANPEYADYLLEVQQLRPTDKNKKRTLLEMELSNYTAKNSFDYFIHKDLGGFLRRELDFYIKNEVINLDYYDTTSEKELMTTLAIGKVISNIGKKIIEFLEQIENFQKKLWLKKKFVIDTNYCITLDRIDKKFYKEIIENKKQQNAWKKLFSIEEEITLENINDNKYLLVDTKFFNDEFKEKLIESIEDIDKNCDGLMIHSDNYQALNLIRKQNEKKVQSIYIDPPYNTEHSQILYKNQFRHSSWLTMIADRLDIANNFLSNEFTIGIAIDDYEFINLSAMLNEYYSGKEISNIIVNHHPQGSGGRLSRTHEYHILISDKTSPAYSGEPVENYDEDRSFMRSGTAENNYRLGRWRSFYALLLDEKEGKVIGVEEPIEIGCDYPKEYTIEGYKRVYPINSKGEERVWRSSYETGKQRVENGEIYITEKGTVYQKISHENKRKVLFSNWIDSKYNAGIHGSNLLGNMGLGSEFDYPKSINTVETALWAQTYGKNDSKILDFFGGSGTTGHAVINLNRSDQGKRKYILVEMGKYFYTATKPRIEKVIYSKEWKNGKPVDREGISHMFKYIELEQYEDSLNNIEFDKDDKQLTYFNDEEREKYTLSYMLDFETKKSSTFLNIDKLRNPFEYKLKIERNDETKYRNVDLIETFNYLLGLNVEQISSKESYDYDGENIEKYFDGQFTFKRVEGKLNDGSKVLVIWRNLTDDIKIDNDVLNKYFEKKRIDVFEYDYIYVNGDNTLEITARDNHKIKLIDQEFKKLMFEDIE
ncbi:DNA methyltransferase [Clostridium perfringens]|uniref:site-specific DNA-methyltransferase n=1 Tax=Clostridium perfringens TaxID=1502 RepID=UPI0018E492E5|nr:DNA methyltransferase [Clostridium perfringens]MBI6060795.1 site-specific DNA-methyltransferase [Clostridium perfringens]